MERQNVESSLAISVGYDPATSTLEIEFKTSGAVWQYYDVPESVFIAVAKNVMMCCPFSPIIQCPADLVTFIETHPEPVHDNP